jgi:diacylglycerol kinase
MRYMIAHEVAVRQEATVLVLAVPLGLFLAPSPPWYVVMIGVLLHCACHRIVKYGD